MAVADPTTVVPPVAEPTAVMPAVAKPTTVVPPVAEPTAVVPAAAKPTTVVPYPTGRISRLRLQNEGLRRTNTHLMQTLGGLESLHRFQENLDIAATKKEL
ncbi:MAG: hypothetical protein ACYDAG_13925, partial [Chloroflexota bacterium]